MKKIIVFYVLVASLLLGCSSKFVEPTEPQSLTTYIYNDLYMSHYIVTDELNKSQDEIVYDFVEMESVPEANWNDVIVTKLLADDGIDVLQSFLISNPNELVDRTIFNEELVYKKIKSMDIHVKSKELLLKEKLPLIPYKISFRGISYNSELFEKYTLKIDDNFQSSIEELEMLNEFALANPEVYFMPHSDYPNLYLVVLEDQLPYFVDRKAKTNQFESSSFIDFVDRLKKLQKAAKQNPNAEQGVAYEWKSLKNTLLYSYRYTRYEELEKKFNFFNDKVLIKHLPRAPGSKVSTFEIDGYYIVNNEIADHSVELAEKYSNQSKRSVFLSSNQETLSENLENIKTSSNAAFISKFDEFLQDFTDVYVYDDLMTVYYETIMKYYKDELTREEFIKELVSRFDLIMNE
jgi:hypothetical protein